MKRTCLICETNIGHRRLNAKICEKKSCQRKLRTEDLQRFRAKKKSQQIPELGTRFCEECGVDISHLHLNHKICKRPECKEARNKKYGKTYQRIRIVGASTRNAVAKEGPTPIRKQARRCIYEFEDGRVCNDILKVNMFYCNDHLTAVSKVCAAGFELGGGQSMRRHGAKGMM